MRCAAAVLLFVAACAAERGSAPCDVATFLCRRVPCDDGGARGPANCAEIAIPCAQARDACPARALVESCLASLAGATLSCPDAEACFARAGCAWIGVRPDGGADGGLVPGAPP